MNRNTEVYDLILDRGIVGALEYANTVDGNKRYASASDVDQIVYRLCRLAQMDNDPNASSWAGQQPQFDPTTGGGIQTPKGFATPGQVAGVGGAAAVAAAARLAAWKRSMIMFQRGKLAQFTKILPDIASDPLKKMEALNIIKSTPQDLDTYQIRGAFLKAIEDEPSLKANPAMKNLFLHDAAGAFAESQSKLGTMAGIANKLSGGTKDQWLHPSLADFIKADPQASMLTPQEIEAMQRMNVNQISGYLQKLDNASGTSSLHTNWDKFIKSDASAERAANFIKEAPSANMGRLTRLITGLTSKYSWLEPIFKIGGKALGILAVALEAKGVFDDFEKYGLDGKTACDFFSVLAGAATMIGALIPAAGEVIGPIAGLAWGVLSIGCMFVHHGEPIQKDPKEEQAKAQDITNLTDEQLEQRAATITFDQLTPKDQSTASKLFNEYKGNIDALNAAFMSNAHNGVFEKPLDVLAVLRKESNSAGVFPGSKPAPAPATPAPTPAPAATPSLQLQPISSFNLRNYRLA